MKVHEVMSEEIRRRLPEEGITLDEMYDRYFGLIAATQGVRPELHGHVVTLDGTIVVPELRPSANRFEA